MLTNSTPLLVYLVGQEEELGKGIADVQTEKSTLLYLVPEDYVFD